MKWEEMRLEEICTKVTSGGTPLRSRTEYYENGDIPWIKTKEVNFNRIYSAEEKITEKGLEESSAKRIPANSIVIAMYGDGNTAGRCAINRIPITTNQACCNLIVDKAKADADFLFYKISTLYEMLRSLKSGGSQQNLNAKTIKELRISLPPLPTQRKIASILSAYDDLIENNRKRIRLLEEQAFLRYKMIVREEKLEEIRLEDIAQVNNASLKTTSQINDILYVDISSVTQGSINEKLAYDIKEAPGRARRIVQHQDIIWSCVRPNRKSYAIVWKPEENLIVSTGFAVISSVQIPPLFLYQCLSTDEFVQYLENNATGSAYPAVTAKDFEQTKILIPSKDVMQEYQETMTFNFDLIYVLQKQTALLREARDILLPRLMSGEIEV